MINIFVLTYNEGKIFTEYYNDDFVNKQFKPHDINFIVLDNGKQPLMKEWCEKHGYTYYASEYNIGSSAGYNWIFKVASMMNLSFAILMQADVEVDSAEPFFVTDNLNNQNPNSFICWPHDMFGFWLNDPSKVEKFGYHLHNLGNLVGFQPQIQKQKNCYFDENFVVTHFDDVEFICWLNNNKLMNVMNASYELGYDTNEYYETPRFNTNRCFVVEGKNFKIKVHHASIPLEKQYKNVEDLHGPWYDFNKPYFDLTASRGFNRLGYDHTRWTMFGYPKYPVEHELKRFAEQYPDLIKTHDLYKI